MKSPRPNAPSILAILQNQWFKDPERVRALYAREPENRRRYIAKFLFMGCRTGQILSRALDDWCDHITWEEASPHIGGASSSVFRPDPAHISRALVEVKPAIVITFGGVARTALAGAVKPFVFSFWDYPHPTARGINTAEIFTGLRERLDALKGA